MFTHPAFSALASSLSQAWTNPRGFMSGRISMLTLKKSYILVKKQKIYVFDVQTAVIKYFTVNNASLFIRA